MSWDPFLIKILLKKEVCRSREQCTRPTEKAGKKKKKKGQTKTRERGTQSKQSSKSHLSLLFVTLVKKCTRSTEKARKRKRKRKKANLDSRMWNAVQTELKMSLEPIVCYTCRTMHETH